jgi:hypothetical protein
MNKIVGYVVEIDDEKFAWYMSPDYPCKIGR